MPRLILCLQPPVKLRYQEWWYEELPKQYRRYFDEVEVVGPDWRSSPDKGQFAPWKLSIEYELRQIEQLLELELRPDDRLLLCDISFPGVLVHLLLHKRPAKCFAICHATSRNRFDYFSRVRRVKWKIESAVSKLFDKVFVATEYHADKLRWPNLAVVGLPLPPWYNSLEALGTARHRMVVTASRPVRQKRNMKLEKLLSKRLGVRVESSAGFVSTWGEYLRFLQESDVLLVTASEETFGYQIVDAISAGCVPIAPRKLSYPELLPDDYLFSSPEEMISKVEAAISGELLPPSRLLCEDRCLNFYEATARMMLC